MFIKLASSLNFDCLIWFDQILADEKMSTIFFIANAAGLLGLVIGPSLVSFFEVSVSKKRIYEKRVPKS